MFLYIATTNDKYELPIAVEDSGYKLARKINVHYSTIFTFIYKKTKKAQKGNFKYFRVKIDD